MYYDKSDRQEEYIIPKGPKNLGVCSVRMTFEQEGMFIVPHLLRHGASVFAVSPKGPSDIVAFYEKHVY